MHTRLFSLALGFPGHMPHAFVSSNRTPPAGAVLDTDSQAGGIRSVVPLAQGKGEHKPPGHQALSHPFSAQSGAPSSHRKLRPNGSRLIGGRTRTETYVHPSHHLSPTLQLPEGKSQPCSNGALGGGAGAPPFRRNFLMGLLLPRLPAPLATLQVSSPVTSLSFSIYVLCGTYFRQ